MFPWLSLLTSEFTDLMVTEGITLDNVPSGFGNDPSQNIEVAIDIARGSHKISRDKIIHDIKNLIDLNVAISMICKN